jgi:hypothetical protein
VLLGSVKFVLYAPSPPDSLWPNASAIRLANGGLYLRNSISSSNLIARDRLSVLILDEHPVKRAYTIGGDPN